MTISIELARQRTKSRFYGEFWIVCLVVSLGAVQAVPLGFYQLRLVDLVLDLSAAYLVGLAIRKRISGAVFLLLLAHTVVLAARVVVEARAGIGAEERRLLFGMAALYMTPVVFFAVRESRITTRGAWTLIFVSCTVCLLSQLGLLPWGESYAAGTVTLNQLLQTPPGTPIELPYQETTITIWRALSVGITMAALIAPTGAGIKGLAIVGLLVQFAGGGGGRSQLLFVACAPLVLVLSQRRRRSRRPLPMRLATAIVIGVALGAFYLWSPVGARDAVKGEFAQTHYERVSELFTIFNGWDAATANGGFNGRTTGYEQYWTRIISDRTTFWFGVGLTDAAAFADTPNKLAHNMVLDIWAVTGLIGLAFHLIFLGWVIADTRRLLRGAPPHGDGQLLAFTYSAAIVYMFQWLLFQAANADRSFMIVFYLLAGAQRPLLAALSAGQADASRSLRFGALTRTHRSVTRIPVAVPSARSA